MIGMNVPYNFGGRSAPVDEIIQKCVQLGVSGVELRTQPVEAFLGLPDSLVTAAAPAAAAAMPSRRRPSSGARARPPPTTSASGASPPRWTRSGRSGRSSRTPASSIEIVKVDSIFVDAGRRASTTSSRWRRRSGRGRFPPRSRTSIRRRRRPRPLPEKRLGAFADKHKLMVGYHGHAETGPKEWKEVFSYARHNGANLDIGHFIVGNKTSPVPFLKEHHDRITHIHVKDRTLDGRNVAFGTG